eukprot:scaffold12591_cov102-Isochrysis_galbana.AAC.4
MGASFGRVDRVDERDLVPGVNRRAVRDRVGKKGKGSAGAVGRRSTVAPADATHGHPKGSRTCVKPSSDAATATSHRSPTFSKTRGMASGACFGPRKRSMYDLKSRTGSCLPFRNTWSRGGMEGEVVSSQPGTMERVQVGRLPLRKHLDRGVGAAGHVVGAALHERDDVVVHRLHPKLGQIWRPRDLGPILLARLDLGRPDLGHIVPEHLLELLALGRVGRLDHKLAGEDVGQLGAVPVPPARHLLLLVVVVGRREQVAWSVGGRARSAAGAVARCGRARAGARAHQR